MIFIILFLSFSDSVYSQTNCDSLQLDTFYLKEITNTFKLNYNIERIKKVDDTTISISKHLKQVSKFAYGNKTTTFYYKNRTLLEIAYFYYNNRCNVAMISRYNLKGKLISFVVADYF